MKTIENLNHLLNAAIRLTDRLLIIVYFYMGFFHLATFFAGFFCSARKERLTANPRTGFPSENNSYLRIGHSLVSSTCRVLTLISD